MLYALTPLALMALGGPPIGDETTPSFLCEDSETTVLSAQVQDDLGLDVAVCLSGEAAAQVLTIRWSGEGGGAAVSCRLGECDGRIEYSRYTSSHLTILQLAWRSGDSIQRLYQTLERAGPSEGPTQTTTHSWQSAGAASSDVSTYELVSDAEPLQLMRLEGVLTPRDWATPLLSKAPQ